jgi:L-lactate dehydrogenase complex protein LldG
MSAREEILDRIRTALSPGTAPAAGTDVGPAGPAPDDVAVGEPTTDGGAAVDPVALFAERVADYRATVRRCDPAGLAAAVADALAGTRQVVAPADLPPQWLSGYAGEIGHDAGQLTPSDLDELGASVVTGCAVAIAETGTIVLDAGVGQGRRVLTLVPDHHVCVVRAAQVVPSVPAALARLADPARPLTFISGPSATSDIELDRVEGVHGPRRLDVIVVAS